MLYLCHKFVPESEVIVSKPQWLICAGILFLLSSAPAYAYLDPVTGTFLIQGLIAGVAAVMASLRSVRERIATVFSSVFRRDGKNGKE